MKYALVGVFMGIILTVVFPSFVIFNKAARERSSRVFILMRRCMRSTWNCKWAYWRCSRWRISSPASFPSLRSMTSAGMFVCVFVVLCVWLVEFRGAWAV